MSDLIIIVFAAIAVNAVIGAVVWAAIDDENKSLLAWYRSCPSPFLQPLVLMAWPVGLFFWWRVKP